MGLHERLRIECLTGDDYIEQVPDTQEVYRLTAQDGATSYVTIGIDVICENPLESARLIREVALEGIENLRAAGVPEDHQPPADWAPND